MIAMDPAATTSFEYVKQTLPVDFSNLQSDATQEGFGFLDRLVNEWASGANRFNKPGEALVVARRDGAIAGIGGVTEDPFQAEALRMRRFYVRPCHRRLGIAKAIAEPLLRMALQTGRPVTLNAGTAIAPAFWEGLGFAPCVAQHHTHMWPTG